MPFVDAAPNFERPGVISGFVMGPGILLTPTFTRGVLFAQGAIYRPAEAPTLPEAPTSRMSWLFYNANGGFYWHDSIIPTDPDDAYIGWVVTGLRKIGAQFYSVIVAVSRQRIWVPKPDDDVTVIGLGALLPEGPGKRTYGDTDVPGILSVGYEFSGRGNIQIVDAFFATENFASVETVTWKVLYRDESVAAVSALTADVEEAPDPFYPGSGVFPVVDGSAFTVGDLYLIDLELIKVQAIDGNNLTVDRGQFSSWPSSHSGPKAITDATNAAPIVVTAAGHGRDGVKRHVDPVSISGVGGNTAANGGWETENQTPSTFELRASKGNGAYTSGGTLAASQLYAVPEKLHTFVFEPELFNTPASGNWIGIFELPGVFVAAVENWAVNSFGQGASGIGASYGPAWRTLQGGQIDLEVEGTLGILSDAVPEITVEKAKAVGLVDAYVTQAPTGGDIRVTVKVNGSAYAELVIADGATSSVGARSGWALGALPAGAKIGLDITSVGSTFPGERLVVRIGL